MGNVQEDEKSVEGGGDGGGRVGRMYIWVSLGVITKTR